MFCRCCLCNKLKKNFPFVDFLQTFCAQHCRRSRNLSLIHLKCSSSVVVFIYAVTAGSVRKVNETLRAVFFAQPLPASCRAQGKTAEFSSLSFASSQAPPPPFLYTQAHLGVIFTHTATHTRCCLTSAPPPSTAVELSLEL